MATVADQLAEYFEDNSVGVIAADENSGDVGIYVTRLPDSPDEAVGILDTGGAPSSMHEPTKNVTFQIVVRSTDYETGMTRAETIRDLLHSNDDTVLVDYEWQSSQAHIMNGQALQEPYVLDREENGRYLIVANYQFLIHT